MTAYALPDKRLLPIGTLDQAKESWMMVSRLPGLSHGDKARARKRILETIRNEGASRVDYQFSVTDRGDRVTLVRLPLLKKGPIYDQKTGKIREITDQTFQEIIANHEAGTVGFTPYMHVGHFQDGKVDYQGSEGDVVLIEPGTGTDEFDDNDPNTLYGYVEPRNDSIVDSIQNRTYRKSSIEFFQNFRDRRTGERKGAVMQAVALTNAPYMPDLGDVEVVALSSNAMSPTEQDQGDLVVAYYELDGGNVVEKEEETSPVPDIQTDAAETHPTAVTEQPAETPAETAKVETTPEPAAVTAEAPKADATPEPAAETAKAEAGADDDVAGTFTQATQIELEPIELAIGKGQLPAQPEPMPAGIVVPQASQVQASVATEAASSAETSELGQVLAQLTAMQEQMAVMQEQVKKTDERNQVLERELVQLSSSAGLTDPFEGMRAQYVAKGVPPALVEGVIALGKGAGDDGLIQFSSGATADPLAAVKQVLDAFPPEQLIELNRQTGANALTQFSSQAAGARVPFAHVFENLAAHAKGQA